MPAGPIQKQDGVHAGGQLLREGGEEQRHGLGRGTRQGKGEGLVGAGPAGGEEIEAVVALVGRARRTHPVLIPAMAHPALLTEPRLVLTPELDPGLRMGRGDGGEP